MTLVLEEEFRAPFVFFLASKTEDVDVQQVPGELRRIPYISHLSVVRKLQ